jgi:1,2-diacylglycerol 3-alpha-glucosyltransferase
MKIGIFTECYKPVINGVVNSIVGFKTGLEALGHEVYVFCPTYKKFKDDPKDKNIIHCKSWPLPGKSGYHFIFPLDKKTKKIASTMDIIHVQHPFIMGDRAADTAEEFKIPLVFTNHTQYEQYAHYIPFSKKFVIKEIVGYIKKFTKRVDLIVAPAKGIEDKLKSYGVKTPITIVPNGIDIKRFENKVLEDKLVNIRNKYNISRKDIVLVFTGRIAEEKNLTFLIYAFKIINSKMPETKLLLVGGGPEIKNYIELAKKININDRVIITDYVPYSEMPKFLSLAKMYVTASKSEVHPLTVIEGLAAGLPCVIVNSPGTGDIVSNNLDGLVSKDDEDDFAKEVIKLIQDNKLRQKLSRGAKITAKKYSYLETSKEMENIYKTLIKKIKTRSK